MNFKMVLIAFSHKKFKIKMVNKNEHYLICDL